MDGLNRVMLIGVLAYDAEVHTLSGGGSVLKFRVGTTETYPDRDQVMRSRTEWHPVTAWGRLGAQWKDKLKQGCVVSIEGQLQHSSYLKGSEKVLSTTVAAKRILLLSEPKDIKVMPADDDPPDPER